MSASVIKSGLPPIHPGMLREILEEKGVSRARFARLLGVAPMRISHVPKGSRPVAAELALLFAHAPGPSPQYWRNPQAAYDLKLAGRQIGTRLEDVLELEAAWVVWNPFGV